MSGAPIIEGAYDARVARVFRVIAARMIRGRFHALRATPGSLEQLRDAGRHPGPLVCCMTHTSWWDPMTVICLHTRCFPWRQACAPIDRAVLQNVRIFRRLGLFGVDPDDPGSMPAVVSYAVGRLQRDPQPTLWITPQGRFQDPRQAMQIRPGVSAILARSPGALALAVAAEYVFWDDKKPELLVHAEAIRAPSSAGSTAAWHRAISRALPLAAERVAEAAVQRDPGRLVTVLGGRGGRTIPFYDALLRLTGRSTEAIRTRRVEPRS
jgi:hypothetical protein